MFASKSHAEPVPVELRQVDGNWQLLRGGEPYRIRGAGGGGPLDQLAAAGANSVRTWNTDDVGPILDEAHALGMTVTVGIWLEHERHGFDYGDRKQVREQLERAREAVLRYKDHPALLLWGVGNEMEGFEAGDDPQIWAAVNEVAAMIKEIDPHHPTMTVTAELGGRRIEMVQEHVPAVDIHGINAYGGAASIAERMRKAGATKPYVITEFGPAGPWEMPTTDWGAPFEQTSTQKAEAYRRTYQQAVLDNPGMALGAYAFLWGSKMEGTSTWFGMLLDDGSRLAALDVMSELWTGNKPADLAPAIEPVTVDTETVVDPGTVI
ncbi:MAG: glycoside hydrolase family 2 TIM barrel-domain containing protein, partial [Woeseiaceae bacterium]|nr:glycoside hydrolase family 2 TIM barrel-domain containing protein [Woeseiaceae bacterium]